MRSRCGLHCARDLPTTIRAHRLPWDGVRPPAPAARGQPEVPRRGTESCGHLQGSPLETDRRTAVKAIEVGPPAALTLSAVDATVKAAATSMRAASSTAPDPHRPGQQSKEHRAIPVWMNDATKLVFSRTLTG